MTTPQELARKAYYGAEAVAAAKEGKTLVFSYASPATLKQAKLEALQLKVQERLKAHMPPPAADPYEGLETHVREIAWLSMAHVCSLCMRLLRGWASRCMIPALGHAVYSVLSCRSSSSSHIVAPAACALLLVA